MQRLTVALSSAILSLLFIALLLNIFATETATAFTVEKPNLERLGAQPRRLAPAAAVPEAEEVEAAALASLSLHVNYAYGGWIQGETDINATVTITLTDNGGTYKDGAVVVADGSGFFELFDCGLWTSTNCPDIVPGDRVFATSDSGGAAEVGPIGEIIGTMDEATNVVAGTLNVTGLTSPVDIDCDVWSIGPPNSVSTTADANGGSFSCDFDDIGHDLQRGDQVALTYYEDDGDMVSNHPNWPRIAVNYGHDWVAANYNPGHTFWITVTDNPGEVKATATISSEYGGGDGNGGFGTEWWDWSPEQPDIAPYDRVHVRADDGYTNTIAVGKITGTVDSAADTITGTISADFVVSLTVECHPWGAWDIGINAPAKNSWAEPDGSVPYSCSWDPASEWDMQPGQQIGIVYNEPDDDQVYNAFQEPAPYLRLDLQGNGQAGEGGNYMFNINYWNDGDAPAENVVITSTLDGMVYLLDTSPFAVTTYTVPGGEMVSLDVGAVPAGDGGSFNLYVDVAAAAFETISNTAQIATGTPGDQGDPGEKTAYWEDTVQNNDTHLNIGKWSWTGDPAAGHDTVFTVNVCNNGNTGSSEVTLNDNLQYPATSLQYWWAQQAGWYELWSNAGEIMLAIPSIPSYSCFEVYLRVTLTSTLQPGDYLTNLATISAANDLETDDNEAVWDGNVGTPRNNLSVYKWWNGGVLAPGGELRYGIGYDNNGNVPSGSFWITDTFPAGATFAGAWHDDPWGGYSFPPAVVTDDYAAWWIDTLDNGYGGSFEVSLNVAPGASPGPITNEVEIMPLPGEDSYDDNSASWTEELNGPGPNLRVRKWHDWAGDSQINYQVLFENIGDEIVSSVWISDDLPPGVQWNGGWDMQFDWSRLVNFTETNGFLTWNFSELNPGDSGWLYFTVDLDEPGVPGRWYTSTVWISSPPGEVNPGDNTWDDVAFSGGELRRVEFWLHPDNRADIWGEAVPGYPVTVTTPYTQVYAWADPNCGGCWNVDGPVELYPGDSVTAEAGDGLIPVVATLPDPFEAVVDTVVDEVTGQIGGWFNRPVEVYGNWENGFQEANTDGAGNFSAPYAKIQGGSSGYIRFVDQVSYADVIYHRPFFSLDLVLEINYGDDWVESRYEPGHTVWITVTNADGSVVKATSEGTTGDLDWLGDYGFSTDLFGWQPNRPDMQANDWVYVATSNGYTDAVQLGDIAIVADYEADVVSGTVDASWVTEPLVDMRCELWTHPVNPTIFDQVDPDGGAFFCDFGSAGYDITPGSTPSAYYWEPDGDRIINMSYWPRIRARYGPNSGDNEVWGYNTSPFATVVVTVTEGGDYQAGETTTADDRGNWSANNLPEGTLDPGREIQVDFGNDLTDTLTIYPISGTADPNTDFVEITAAGPPYFTVDLEYCSPDGWCDWHGMGDIGLSGVVSANLMAERGYDVRLGDSFEAHLYVDNGHEVIYAWALPAPELGVWKGNSDGHARPGGVYAYSIAYANQGNGPAENTLITDTLPAGTSYAGDTGGYTVTVGAGNVVTWELGTVDPGPEEYFVVTVDVSPGTPTGTGSIDQNCLAISTTSEGDWDPGNNNSCAGPVDVWEDEVELGVNKWSQPNDPTPGQEFDYYVGLCNNRGAAAGPVVLTDTLPTEVALLAWWSNDWFNPWSEISVGPDHLVLEAPSIPGNRCENLTLRVLLDPGVENGTTLENWVEIAVDGDVDPGNNWQLDTNTHASPPRYDLWVGKSRNNGILVAGGYAGFSIDYSNNGNTETTVRITDTVPAGFSYVEGWWAGHTPWNGQPIPDPTIIGNQLIWDLPAIPVNGGHGFNIILAISDTVTAGPLLENCAVIAAEGDDSYPDNNESCVPFTVQPGGPNLWVDKWHNWNGDGQLGYQVNFANFGDEAVSDVWITDTLPMGTYWDGWWDMGFEWDRLVGGDVIVDGDRLIWHFTEIYPGDWGWIQFNANLDDPGAPLQWYTNTVEITAPPGETAPDDNVWVDATFSGGEVQSLDISVYGNWIQGYAPRGPIVITTPHEEDVLPWGGDFNWNLDNNLYPGDVVTVTAGDGLSPVVVQIPDPFDVEASSLTDHVSGQVDHLDNVWLEVDINGGGSIWTQTDGDGFFDVLFPDIPRHGEGEVRYYTQVDYTAVTFHRYWRSPDLRLEVEYDQDRVEGRYPLGHTVWITVTEGNSSTVKGTAELPTGWFMNWDDFGFSTNDGWLTGPPDIIPGDWIFARADDGFTSTLRVHAINGEVDVDADSISGTVEASWYVGDLDWMEVECHPWGAWNSGQNDVQIKYNQASPDGSAPYFCGWDPGSEWDIDYGQEIGVWVPDEDGDYVIRAFEGAAVELGIWKWHSGGHARPGGVVLYGLDYQNNGSVAAENVLITDTLPAWTSYADDTSGLPVTIGPGNVITWDLGLVDREGSGTIWVTLDVDQSTPTGTGVIEPNCARISSSTIPELDPGNGETCSDPIDVWEDEVEIGVDKWPHPGDPYPGETYFYYVQWCNNRGAAAGPVVLTDTLPAGATFRNWGEVDGASFWNEVSFDGSQLVLYAPGLPGNQCGQIKLILQQPPDEPLDTILVNEAAIYAAGDVDPDNNHTINDRAQLSPPRYDLYIDKGLDSGQLYPGGHAVYSVYYYNGGNISTTVTLTETVPAGLAFENAWWSDNPWWVDPQYGQDQPLPDPVVDGNLLVWELPPVWMDKDRSIQIAFSIDQGLPEGTDLVNCVSIAGEGPDSWPADNERCTTITVNGTGPNLWVEKWHDWHGDGQLGYQINFANRGDQTVSDVWITDTLPAGTQWDSWWDMDFDWGRLASGDVIVDGDQLKWHFSELYPGDQAWIQFNANLDEPGAPLRWYTNTVEITVPAGETASEDNTWDDGAFSGGEIQRVEINVYGNGIWGYAPSGPITITTPYEEVVLPWGGDFNWDLDDAFLPGDVVIVAAGAGLAPVTIEIPDPFDVEASSITDHLWGQVDHLDNVRLEIDRNHGAVLLVQTDSNGFFDVLLPDIARGDEGEVRYNTQVDYTEVTFHHYWRSPDLFLLVDYGYDRVEGLYEPGHTVWITVTESDGSTVKGTAELGTGVFPWWSGGTGFSTDWHGWTGAQPDLLPGDWVFGRVDNGYTGTVRIVEIDGAVDVESDQVTGELDAAWYDVGDVPLLDVQCHPWGAWNNGIDAAVKYSQAPPDRSAPFLCAWDPNTEWDIDYYQEIYVHVYEPDGDEVIRPLAGEAVDLFIGKWALDPYARPGGVAMYGLLYQNNGNIPAENVQIVDTLPADTTYAGDTSGFPVTIGAGNEVTWDLGTVDPGEFVIFRLTLDVDPGAGTIVSNHVTITTTTAPVLNPDDDEAWSDPMDVLGEDVEVGVDKWAWPEDPAPGEIFFYTVEWCNNRESAAGPVVLTDTLPSEATLLEWREGEWWMNYWTEASFDGSELVLEAPGLQGGTCAPIELVMQLDPDTPAGTTLVNAVAIHVDEDANPDNDYLVYDLAHAGPPRYDVGISKRYHNGVFSPGGWGVYQIDYWNNSNVSTTVVIEEAVPPGLIYESAWWGGDQDDQGLPLPDPEVFGNLLTWELERLPVGGQRQFFIQFNIDPEALPGSEFGNCISISGEGEDSQPDDNESCETIKVNEPGPNLRVIKSHSWPNESQISYEITFLNIGDEPFFDVLITDTLPISVTSPFEPNIDHWSPVHILDNRPEGQWGFVVEQLEPGDRGTIWFDVDLDDPALMPAWYTNTVEITGPGDIDLDDNLYKDLAAKVPEALLRVEPPLAQLSVGDSLEVEVLFENINDLSGLDLQMTFDPAVVEVTSIGLGNCPEPDIDIDHSFNNVTGVITYTVLRVAPSPPCHGDGVALRVTFHALTGGSSPIHFASWEPIDSDLFLIPVTAQDGVLEISDQGLLQGRVELQGRRDHSGAVVTVKNSAGSVISVTTTGSTGRYSFWLPTGVYTVTVDMDSYLDGEKGGVSVSDGATTFLSRVKLLGGDANESDLIDILDLAFMGGRYLERCGDPGYDVRADINNDCLIDIRDLTAAGVNYLQTSPVAWP